MSSLKIAARAYGAATGSKSTREQEADLFRSVIARLQAGRMMGPSERVRVLADNRRLWITVIDLVADPTNTLPVKTRAGILSIGAAVQRELDAADPNFDFLITVNKHLAEGLSGNP